MNPADNCEVPRWIQIKQTLKNLSYNDFVAAYQEDQKSIVLDVRTAEEFSVISLDKAINLDYLSQTLADELESLSIDKNYYVYCRTGRRSLRVCALMQNIGYNVFNLDGGLLGKEV